MKKLTLPIVIFIFVFFFFGYKMIQGRDTNVNESYINNQYSINTGHDDWIDIKVKNAQIHVYIWKKYEVEAVFETNQAQSEILLCRPEENVIRLNAENSTGNSFDNSVIKIYMPNCIDGICISAKECSLTMEDDIICDVYLTAKKSDVSIKSITGKIYYKSEQGSLIIESGKMCNDSFVSLKEGNIRINAIPEIGESTFQTGFGDIYFKIPVRIDIDIYACTVGYVKENFFNIYTRQTAARIINLKSKMGTINITN